MKKILLFVALLGGGFALGTAAGWLVTTTRIGLSSARLVRAAQQRSLWEFGTNAFTAYLDGPPDAAVFALRYHLHELDEEQHTWGTNWSGILSLKDLARMRVAANVRLAILFRGQGNVQEASNHLELAWQSLRGFRSPPTGVTNREDLIMYFRHEDKKGEWF